MNVRATRLALLTTCMLGPWISGCPSATRNLDTEALAKLRETRAPEARSRGCELTLMLAAHPPSGAPRDDRRAFHIEETCIKRTAEPIVFPPEFDVVFAQDSRGMRNDWRMCEGDARSEGTLFRCTWDRGFRDGFPMDIILRHPRGAPLNEVLGGARVYLNGALIASLGASALQSHTAVFDGTDLRRSRMPFGAPLSLRLLPAGTPPPEAILTASRPYLDLLGQRLKQAAPKILAEALPDLGCTTLLLDHVVAFVARVTGRTLDLVLPKDFTCKNEDLKTSVAAAGKKLDDLAKTIQDVQADPSGAAQDLVQKTLEQVGKADVGSVTEAIRALREVLVTALTGAQQDTRVVVEAIDVCLSALEKDLTNLAPRLVAAVRTLRSSPKTQADLYRNIVDTIAADPPEALTANPALLENEAELKMHYRDYHQNVVMQAWNGVPVAPIPGVVDGKPDLSVLVPFVDIIGFREQFDSGPLGSFSGGIGVHGFLETSARDSEEYFRLGLHGSLAVGAFRVGLGWTASMCWQDEGSPFRHQLRVLLGADLVKLISGTLGASGDFDADPGNETGP